jgi:hypothetical protein
MLSVRVVVINSTCEARPKDDAIGMCSSYKQHST